MFESLNDPVDVLTAYVEGGMQPLRFRWRGRTIRVRKVTGRWNRREGQGTYELCFDPRGPKWILSRAWIGGEA